MLQERLPTRLARQAGAVPDEVPRLPCILYYALLYYTMLYYIILYIYRIARQVVAVPDEEPRLLEYRDLDSIPVHVQKEVP